MTSGGGSGGSSSTGAGGSTSSAGGAAGKGGAGGGSGGSTGASGGIGSGGGGRGGGGGTGGSGGARDAGTDSSGVDCTALRNDLDAKLAVVQACDPNSMAVQCRDLVDGVCCMVPVRSAQAPEMAAYLTALVKYRNAHCVTACTQALCPIGPGSCVADPSGAGKCAFGPLPTGP
jgi:hypothetical protein